MTLISQTIKWFKIKKKVGVLIGLVLMFIIKKATCDKNTSLCCQFFSSISNININIVTMTPKQVLPLSAPLI